MRHDELLLHDIERQLVLRELLGGHVDAATLAATGLLGRRVTYEAGATVLDADEPQERVHVVLSGTLRVTRSGRVWTFSEEKRYSDLFWLARDPVPIAIDAVDGAEVLEFPAAGLEDLFEEHFALGRSLTKRLATALLEATSDERKTIEIVNEGPSLTGRLRGMALAMPFAHEYIDALLQLHADATEVRLDQATSPALYVPLEGNVSVSGRDALLGVGGVELLAGRPFTPRDSTCTALAISEDALLDVLEDHRSLARDLLAAIAGALMVAIEPR